MATRVWISDREPGVRQLFADQLPDAEVLLPHEVEHRLASDDRPDGIVIDGTQLMELPARRRRSVLGLPRVLVCTGMLLASMPTQIAARPNVAVLAKPFCVDDLEAAVEWLRGAPATPTGVPSPLATMLSRPRPRRQRMTQPLA